MPAPTPKNTVTIDWDSYRPGPPMQAAIDLANGLSLADMTAGLPAPIRWRGRRATFSYRLFSDYPLDAVEKVYVLVSGFAERAETLDAGVKGAVTELLVRQVDHGKYAVLVVGGLFTFPARERNKLLRQGSGALALVVDTVTDMLKATFGSLRAVSVAGYSMGGVLAPLVAQAVLKRRVAAVDQVGCGEPTFSAAPTTRLRMLRRTARASAYRNEQIRASDIRPYIAVKKTPESAAALLAYRAKLYQPLLRRTLSMRLVVRDLALQANDYQQSTGRVQLQSALRYLARHGVNIDLLHAEHSVICQGPAFYRLAQDLRADTGNLRLTVIIGSRADHGIEEQRGLSTPFLVRPELYLTA